MVYGNVDLGFVLVIEVPKGLLSAILRFVHLAYGNGMALAQQLHDLVVTDYHINLLFLLTMDHIVKISLEVTLTVDQYGHLN